MENGSIHRPSPSRREMMDRVMQACYPSRTHSAQTAAAQSADPFSHTPLTTMEASSQGRTQPAAPPDRKPQQQAFSRRIDCAPKQDAVQPQHGAGRSTDPHLAPGGDV